MNFLSLFNAALIFPPMSNIMSLLKIISKENISVHILVCDFLLQYATTIIVVAGVMVSTNFCPWFTIPSPASRDVFDSLRTQLHV